ncbi:MAG TPA: glycosyltransferase family 4 protein [Burkholderiaceae bacterium]|nr:glycosyltransferase family 4 protein [Burkholderiaceae bacterium]
MNVLILTQYFWPETFRINEVALSLREAGADVTVLTGQPNYPEGRIFDGYRGWGLQRESFDGIPVYRVPMAPRGSGSGVRLAINYLSFAASASVLGPWQLRGRKVDVIFVYGISPILQAIAGIVLKWVKRATLVVWVQDLWPQSLQATGFVHNPLILRAVGVVVRGIYRFSDLLLVQSPAFVEEVAALAAREKIAYHPNPGELALQRRDAPIAPCPIRFEPAFNVVFAGNLGSAQAVDVIVDAAERLKGHAGIRFVLVGAGSRADWIRQEIARRGLDNVDLPGRLPPEAMPAVLARASVLLVTLARSDVFRLTVPSKLQAYLAAGKPILAALDGEGARVVAEAGAGVCVPAEDPAALADAVLALAARPQRELDAMGARARAYYDAHFAPDLLARRLLSVFAAGTAGTA